MLVSAASQHESAIGTHMSPPSQTSLPPPTPSHPSRLSQSTPLNSLRCAPTKEGLLDLGWGPGWPRSERSGLHKQSSTRFQEPDVWQGMGLTAQRLNRCFTLSLLTFRSSNQTPSLGYLSNTLGWHPLCLSSFYTLSPQVRLSSQIHFIVQDYCLVHSGLDGTQIS